MEDERARAKEKRVSEAVSNKVRGKDEKEETHEMDVNSVTRPVPTVFPPSLSENRDPTSMGVSWVSSQFISRLSPGMTC